MSVSCKTSRRGTQLARLASCQRLQQARFKHGGKGRQCPRPLSTTVALWLCWPREVRAELFRSGTLVARFLRASQAARRLVCSSGWYALFPLSILKCETLHSGLARESISKTCIKQEFAEFDDGEPGASTLKRQDTSRFAKSTLRGLPAPDDPWYWPGRAGFANTFSLNCKPSSCTS